MLSPLPLPPLTGATVDYGAMYRALVRAGAVASAARRATPLSLVLDPAHLLPYLRSLPPARLAALSELLPPPFSGEGVAGLEAALRSPHMAQACVPPPHTHARVRANRTQLLHTHAHPPPHTQQTIRTHAGRVRWVAR